MRKAPLPFDEKQRHLELLKYNILDTQQEAEYDDLAELTSVLCDTASAGISFIDTDRQWFKAAKNVSFNEGKRDISFCGHVILHNEVLVIEDALNDERFEDNPNVTSIAKIRFYAAAPIITRSGKRVGAVCAFDEVPNKNITKEKIKGLQTIAKQVSKLLELRLLQSQIVEHTQILINAEKDIAKKNLFKNEIKNDEIAYELHENIAQVIAAAKMKIETIQNEGSFSLKTILEVKEYLGVILNDVTRLSNYVTPTTYKSADYLDYVDRMISNFKKNHEVKISFLTNGNEVKFTNKIGLAFYRIIQYQLMFAELTQATAISFKLNNTGNATLIFEHNGLHEYAIASDADLMVNNMNTHAESINALFTHDAKNKRMKVFYRTDHFENNN